MTTSENTDYEICYLETLLEQGYTYNDCPDYGSTSCPISMHENVKCDMPIEDLKEILSYKWKTTDSTWNEKWSKWYS